MGTFTITIGDGSRKALSWDPSVDSEKLEHTITLSGGAGGPHTAVIQPGGGTASFTVTAGWWDVKVEGKLNGVLKSVGTERVNVKAGQKNAVKVTMGDPSKLYDPPIAPPTSWTAVANSTFGSDTINAIGYGGGTFVAGGLNGKMAYSTDGINWTAVANSTFGTTRITAIGYGGGTFVAVNDTYSCEMAYSADGITWTAVTNNVFASGGSSTIIKAIGYGGGTFVAGGLNDRMAYSADGITWTNVKNYSGSIYAIGYGGGTFVAGGSSGKMAYFK
jgi:hypothetical protein